MSSYHPNRIEKPSKDRGAPRARRLQLSDVDWYAKLHDNMEPIDDVHRTFPSYDSIVRKQ